VAEGRVVQQLLPPTVGHRQDTAGAATLELLVGLHRQPQPAAAVLHSRQDTHTRNAEHHRCRRAALSTVHLVEAFGTVSLVAADP
jgi:hypothetical protein